MSFPAPSVNHIDEVTLILSRCVPDGFAVVDVSIETMSHKHSYWLVDYTDTTPPSVEGMGRAKAKLQTAQPPGAVLTTCHLRQNSHLSVWQARYRKTTKARETLIRSHVHQCRWCDRPYTHEHPFSDPNHLQFKGQCPRSDCPAYHKGNDSTNSKVVKQSKAHRVLEVRPERSIKVSSKTRTALPRVQFQSAGLDARDVSSDPASTPSSLPIVLSSAPLETPVAPAETPVAPAPLPKATHSQSKPLYKPNPEVRPSKDVKPSLGQTISNFFARPCYITKFNFDQFSTCSVRAMTSKQRNVYYCLKRKFAWEKSNKTKTNLAPPLVSRSNQVGNAPKQVPTTSVREDYSTTPPNTTYEDLETKYRLKAISESKYSFLTVAASIYIIDHLPAVDNSVRLNASIILRELKLHTHSDRRRLLPELNSLLGISTYEPCLVPNIVRLDMAPPSNMEVMLYPC